MILRSSAHALLGRTHSPSFKSNHKIHLTATEPSSPPGAPKAPHAKAGAGRRPSLTIEGSFETAESELGLDHDESRSWHGWHRYVSLVMAFAMMAVIRHRTDVVPLKKAAAPSHETSLLIR
jgi:hypothetical protein